MVICLKIPVKTLFILKVIIIYLDKIIHKEHYQEQMIVEVALYLKFKLIENQDLDKEEVLLQQALK